MNILRKKYQNVMTFSWNYIAVQLSHITVGNKNLLKPLKFNQVKFLKCYNIHLISFESTRGSKI